MLNIFKFTELSDFTYKQIALLKVYQNNFEIYSGVLILLEWEIY